MSADNKSELVKILNTRLVPTYEGSSISDMIKEQDAFFKVIKEYANKAWVVELTKAYNIIGNEICCRAEVGDIYKDVSEKDMQINPSRCSTPLIDFDPLYEPLHLKSN